MDMNTTTPPAAHGHGAIDSGDGKTALIVDDRPEFLGLIAPWLTDLGYHILTAADGKEAQGMMMAKGIVNTDLLVTDLDMPRMQGDELARWFTQENPGVGVLLISGQLAGTKLSEGIAFLQKPFSREAFLARVGDLLGPHNVTAAIPAPKNTISS